MGRILAIDYGRKRTGIAVTDTLQIVANGLTTVPTHQLLTFLKQYVAKEPVERIVVGLPKQMNNEPSESMRYIKPFLAQLAKEMPQMPVEMYDERFTSVIAHRAMLDGGMKKTRAATRRLSTKSLPQSSSTISSRAGDDAKKQKKHEIRYDTTYLFIRPARAQTGGRRCG